MKKHQVIRGNLWILPFIIDTPNLAFDWTTVAIRSVLKSDFSDSQPLYEFAITPVYSSGAVSFSLEIPGAVTETLPDTCVGDIRLERSSPLFGPYTPYQFQLEILPRVTE